MKNKSGHLSVFTGRTGVDSRHKTFQRIFGRAKPHGAGRTLRHTVNANHILNSEAKKTAPTSCCPTAFFDRGLRGYLGFGMGKMSSIRVIRGSILPLRRSSSFRLPPSSFSLTRSVGTAPARNAQLFTSHAQSISVPPA